MEQSYLIYQCKILGFQARLLLLYLRWTGWWDVEWGTALGPVQGSPRAWTNFKVPDLYLIRNRRSFSRLRSKYRQTIAIKFSNGCRRLCHKIFSGHYSRKYEGKTTFNPRFSKAYRQFDRVAKAIKQSSFNKNCTTASCDTHLIESAPLIQDSRITLSTERDRARA